MTELAPKKFSLVGMLWASVALASGSAFLFTLTGFLDRWWWMFDLTSHFRVQYAGMLLASTVIFALKRKIMLTVLCALFALANLVLVSSYFPVKQSRPRIERSLRAVLINVRTENQRFDLVRNFVEDTQPDFVVLEEADADWIVQLASLTNDYPHAVLKPREDNFGIALFSKLPFLSSDIVFLGDAEVPSIVASFRIDGRELTLLATHPVPPGNREYVELRNGQLAAIPSFLANLPGAKAVLGDLNVTPWCYQFRKLLSETGLEDSSRHRGIHATWPTHLLPLRIPIDHCLLSTELETVRKEVGPYVGSDHFPLLVEFGFAR
ncbi:MAG: endonuclease/exonuclease/phosphatase family protein [Verrucomicrobia bacterium]|nr:endonuclease/exonuclease/phosphatase family protein [Verrucomicrobiota bacterium]